VAGSVLKSMKGVMISAGIEFKAYLSPVGLRGAEIC